jgi:hypothetical protein
MLIGLGGETGFCASSAGLEGQRPERQSERPCSHAQMPAKDVTLASYGCTKAKNTAAESRIDDHLVALRSGKVSAEVADELAKGAMRATSTPCTVDPPQSKP